uniref:RING-type domain-containing protein n=1 Tax=viral metagenome TaxID=1070528 RepID=A0A6C0J1P7_9ZZZZ
MEIEKKIINNIVNILYKTYPLDTFFVQNNFRLHKDKLCSVFYRAKSSAINNLTYGYHIQIHLLELKKNMNTFRFYQKKCVFCKLRCVDSKLTCCGKYTHQKCYMKNRHQCCNNLKKVKIQEECPVCFSLCNTKTDCNHTLCETCMTEIKKQPGKTLCPYCRDPINKLEFNNKLFSMCIDDNDIINIKVQII